MSWARTTDIKSPVDVPRESAAAGASHGVHSLQRVLTECNQGIRLFRFILLEEIESWQDHLEEDERSISAVVSLVRGELLESGSKSVVDCMRFLSGEQIVLPWMPDTKDERAILAVFQKKLLEIEKEAALRITTQLCLAGYPGKVVEKLVKCYGGLFRLAGSITQNTPESRLLQAAGKDLDKPD